MNKVTLMKKKRLIHLVIIVGLLSLSESALGLSEAFKGSVYNPGKLKPIDSQLKVKVGEPAPDFTLPSVAGENVSLGFYKGKKNVVISFVPAAWTPVCSDQWPGYNIVKGLFDENDAVLLGITADNIPTLYAWTREMGELWFPVLSDFWPHGAVAADYGVLRTDGTTERALIFIDKEGVVRHIHVEDINVRPKLEIIAAALEEMNTSQ
jgi:peroxiredoxin (alkyl hydroperoxide reductase subunit C)